MLSEKLIKDVNEIDTFEFITQTHIATNFDCVLISKSMLTATRPAFTYLNELKSGMNT